jgi:hypothetical protein
MFSYYDYTQMMKEYNMIAQDKCINMTHNDNSNIVCHTELFNFFNMLVTILLTSGIGIYLSVAIVSYFVNNFMYGTDKSINEETNTNNEFTEYNKLYNEIFSTLPKDGYNIHTYPFTYKLEDKTPYGNIIMFLNVYSDDYLTNDDSIEYTYYSQSNSWTFEQLSIVAKKISIELNTKQFYKDKTIQYGVTREELIQKQNETNNDETSTIKEDKKEDNTENTEQKNKIEMEENKSVFAKFKSYNKGKGSMSGNIVKSVSDENNEEPEPNNDNLIKPSRIRRIGTIEEYKIEILKSEIKKRIKNVSFGEFKIKNN